MLKVLLQIRQEFLGIGTVDDPMIVRQCKIRHLPNSNVVVAVCRGQNLCSLFDRADAEDRDLRLIYDRRSIKTTENTGIRDGKCSALHLVRFEAFCPGTVRKVVCCDGELRQRKSIGVSDHRNDQAPIESDGHAEIYIAFVNDFITVDLRIDDAMLADSRRYRLENKRHERELCAKFCLKLNLICVAEFRDICHVDFVNTRYMSRGLFRERHMLGDLLTHHRHFLDAVLGRLDSLWRRECDRPRGRLNADCFNKQILRSKGGSRLDERKNVLLGHAAADTGPGNSRNVDTMFACDISDERTALSTPKVVDGRITIRTAI